MANISVSPEGIVKIFKAVSEYRNRDKDTICMGIGLTQQMMSAWYDEIVEKFTMLVIEPAEGSEYRPSDEVLASITKFTLKRGFVPPEQASLAFLEKVVEDLDKGKPRGLVDKLEPKDVSKIGALVKAFENEAVDFKYALIEDKQLRGYTYNRGEAKKVREWLKSLELKTKEIEQLATSIRKDIGCSYASTRQLYEDLNR